MLDKLSTYYSLAVVLRYWYDMSYREIAETMGVTESTIKTRLHRARAKLAKYALAQKTDGAHQNIKQHAVKGAIV